MTRPLGVTTKVKNNDHKHHSVREDWNKGKKLGRKKQVWIPGGFVEHTGQPFDGHWEVLDKSRLN